MAESRILDFEANKIEKLTLEELKLTCSEAAASGKPLHGIEHFQIFEAIQEVLDKRNIGNSVLPIYASDGGDSALKGVARIPLLEQQLGVKTLQAMILRRLIGGIKLSDFEDDESHGMIAISFHQRGVQIAYGQNITYCGNLTIFGAGNSMATFQNGISRAMPDFRKMLEVIQTWAEEHGRKRTYDLTVMRRMKEIHLAHEKVAEVLGFMTMMRIGRDKLRTEKAYPLNQSQINLVGERYMQIPEEQRPVSLWKFYNSVTEMHKAGSTDLPLIIDNNVVTGQFLTQHFGLTPEIIEAEAEIL